MLRNIPMAGYLAPRPKVGEETLGLRRAASQNKTKIILYIYMWTQNQTVEPSLRPLALALARLLTLRQPMLQAWTSAVDQR